MRAELIHDFAAVLDPRHTALLIIDMQKDFCLDGFATSRAGRPLAAAQAIVPRIARLRATARETGVLVCHIGFLTLRDELSHSAAWLKQRRRSTFASDSIALEGTKGAEFIEELRPEDGELTVFKHRYNAFRGTALDLLLRANAVRTVVPVGVSTNVCVESTLRDAFERGYEVCLPADLCASWDEELHRATLKTVNARFGTVCTGAEIADAWRLSAA